MDAPPDVDGRHHSVIQGDDDLEPYTNRLAGIANPAYVPDDDSVFNARHDAIGCGTEATYVAYSAFGDISFGTRGLPTGFAQVGT